MVHPPRIFLRAALPKGIDLVEELRCERTTVAASAIDLQQILVNLCSNSADAIGSRRNGRIVVGCELLPGQGGSGTRLRVFVTDDGPGIDADIVDKIFDPLFTTKAVGQGTGLGLSIVKSIVENLGGEISADSVPGYGTTLSFTLPIVGQSDVSPDKPEQQGAVRANRNGRPGRVLFVDDEEMLTRLYQRVISSAGHDVTVGHSAEEAMEVLKAGNQAFDILITDQSMPGMTGLEFAEQVRTLFADMPIVLCSGFIDDEAMKEAKRVNISKVLDKPVSNQQMLSVVEELLPGGDSASS